MQTEAFQQAICFDMFSLLLYTVIIVQVWLLELLKCSIKTFLYFILSYMRLWLLYLCLNSSENTCIRHEIMTNH